MALRLYSSQTHIVLVRSHADYIVVERGSGRISFNSAAPAYHYSPVLEVWALLGLVKVEAAVALVVVTSRSAVGRLNDSDIYSIDAVKVLDTSPLQDESQAFARVAKLFTCGCYYASGYNLTRPFAQQKAGSIHENADPRFYWNRDMYTELLECGLQAAWLTPIIQGYVGSFTYGLPADQIVVTLISRRSCYMAGTRYNARGVDDEGNVANFVESEQVLSYRNSTLCFLQVRGSVPVFWQQTGLLSAPVRITRSEDSAAPAFLRHFRTLLSNYRHVMIINLLSHKAKEAQLTAAYNAQLRRHAAELQEHVCKFEFDYHAECKHDRHSQVRLLVNEVHDMLAYYRFFAVGALNCEQLGVPRINCLDCLDRTNVVMARLGWESFVLQLSLFEVPVLADFDHGQDDVLLRQFKRLWANCGDFLSKQYTGVGSVSTSITRDGKKGLSGIITHGVRSVGRILSAASSYPQENIDMVLPTVQRDVDDKLHMISVRVCSWNLGGDALPLIEDMRDWLIDPLLTTPHLVVVGLQQLTKKLLASPKYLVERWNERVSAVLSEGAAEYKWVHTVSLQGCVLSLFARQELLPEVQEVEECVIKPGLKQALQARGATLLRLTLHEATLCFINCRLPSGVGALENRLSLLSKIHRKGFRHRRKVPSVAEHDFKVLFGDLNFGISLEDSAIRAALETNRTEELRAQDQLLSVKPRSPALEHYQEGELNFAPTFKYAKKSHSYDYSKPPAWCDRVLYSGRSVQQISYSRTESLHSCHRPVSTTLLVPSRPLD